MASDERVAVALMPVISRQSLQIYCTNSSLLPWQISWCHSIHLEVLKFLLDAVACHVLTAVDSTLPHTYPKEI